MMHGLIILILNFIVQLNLTPQHHTIKSRAGKDIDITNRSIQIPLFKYWGAIDGVKLMQCLLDST